MADFKKRHSFKDTLRIEIEDPNDKDADGVNSVLHSTYQTIKDCTSTPRARLSTKAADPEMPDGLDLSFTSLPNFRKRKRSIDMSIYRSLTVLPFRDACRFCGLDILTDV